MGRTMVLGLVVLLSGCLADEMSVERSRGQALCFSVNDLDLGFGFVGFGCGQQQGCSRRGQNERADRLGVQYGGFYDGAGCRERAGWDRNGQPNWQSPRNLGGGAYGYDGNWYPQNQGCGGGGYYDCSGGGGGGCGFVDQYGGDRPRNQRQTWNDQGAWGQEDAYYDCNGNRNEPGWYYDDRGQQYADNGDGYWVDDTGNCYYSYSGEGSGGCYDGYGGYQDNQYW